MQDPELFTFAHGTLSIFSGLVANGGIDFALLSRRGAGLSMFYHPDHIPSTCPMTFCLADLLQSNSPRYRTFEVHFCALH